MQVSAAVVNEIGAPFHITGVDVSEPAPDEVLVQIAGVGICHTDIAVKEGHLPFPFPGVLGHEGSGTIVAARARASSCTSIASRSISDLSRSASESTCSGSSSPAALTVSSSRRAR